MKTNRDEIGATTAAALAARLAAQWRGGCRCDEAIAAGYDPELEDMGMEDPDFGA